METHLLSSEESEKKSHLLAEGEEPARVSASHCGKQTQRRRAVAETSLGERGQAQESGGVDRGLTAVSQAKIYRTTAVVYILSLHYQSRDTQYILLLDSFCL